MSKINILLLTNRDSDNVGDQIIEESVISLITGIMRNLGISRNDFRINSRAAGIISKKYMSTLDDDLLQGARDAISQSDLIVFGGAPLFNYSYQNFYRRTIYTLRLAEEYGVPVIFSSIGVEPFDPENGKCLELQEALRLSCVKQITTRDNLEAVRQYVAGTDIPVAHVADPAVFADIVFRRAEGPTEAHVPRQAAPASFSARARRSLARRVGRLLRSGGHRVARPPQTAKASPEAVTVRAAAAPRAGKRIGLVVTRPGIFKDNGIPSWGESRQRQFWLDVIARLEAKGHDYRLFTTGHFSDEVFLDSFIKAKGIPQSKAKITINSPEELTTELRECDGVIAYRLHASITSFAFDVPSVGLNWNFKVPYFYESVGHADRALEPERWTAEEVIPVLERAMSEGVVKDERFVMTVYETLFDGIRRTLFPEKTERPYTMQELRTALPRYEGTSRTQYEAKVQRKLRRTYENYQKLTVQLRKKTAEADKA